MALLLSGPEGYISSHTTDDVTPCSWKIDADPGQRVNFTLIDFNILNQNGGDTQIRYG